MLDQKIEKIARMAMLAFPADMPERETILKCSVKALHESVVLNLSLSEIEKYSQAADLILSIPEEKMRACQTELAERLTKLLEKELG